MLSSIIISDQPNVTLVQKTGILLRCIFFLLLLHNSHSGHSLFFCS